MELYRSPADSWAGKWFKTEIQPGKANRISLQMLAGASRENGAQLISNEIGSLDDMLFKYNINRTGTFRHRYCRNESKY